MYSFSSTGHYKISLFTIWFEAHQYLLDNNYNCISDKAQKYHLQLLWITFLEAGRSFWGLDFPFIWMIKDDFSADLVKKLYPFLNFMIFVDSRQADRTLFVLIHSLTVFRGDSFRVSKIAKIRTQTFFFAWINTFPL